MTELEGKFAIITGAGSGMAKASTKVFIREGARVLAADISGGLTWLTPQKPEEPENCL